MNRSPNKSQGDGQTSYGGSQRNQNVSDDYWYNLFKGSEYEEQYNNIINKYGVAIPSTFWGSLTGQNKTNAYNHEMKKRDELTALYDQMYKERYQSYSNQVEQMKDAGLNPDLSGVSGAGAPGSSSPSGIPEIMAESPLGVTTSIASQLMSIVGVASNMMQIFGAGLALDSQRLDNQQKMEQSALAYILDRGITPFGATDPFNENTGRLQSIVDFAGHHAKFLGYSRRQSKKFQTLVSGLIRSPRFSEKYYSIFNRTEGERQSYIQKTSGNLYSDQDDVVRVLIGELINSRNALEKNRTKFESDYYGSLDGKTKAEYENTLYKQSKQDLDNNMLKHSERKLKSLFDEGNTFAGIVLGLLQNLGPIVDGIGKTAKKIH